MNFLNKKIFLLSFFALSILVSCEDEPTDSSNFDIETIIEANSNLANLIQSTSENIDVTCVDFQYPISFSIYNTSFQIIDTIVIESNEVLFMFINNLNQSTEGVILASINFPVTLVYDNAETITVNSNQELSNAINDASNNCDENPSDFECFADIENTNLVECDSNDGSDGDNTAIFNLTQVYESCMDLSGIAATYHISQADAETNTNAISNPEGFSNTTDPQIIYTRIENADTGHYEIFEISLAVAECVVCENPNFLTNDLIIYMPFSNEAINLIDYSSAENLPIDFIEDRNGNPTCAVAFDGTNHLTIPINEDNQLIQGDAFSVSIWFKMQNTNAGDYEGIFQKGQTTSEGFQLVVYDLNTPLFGDSTNSFGLWDSFWNQEIDVEWENTDWHHLVITVDENNTVSLYRDGVIRNFVENSTIDIGSTPLENYFIGLGFQGHLDDLRVYKRALSPNDVGDLYSYNAECFNCF